MTCIAREIRVDRFENIPETALAWHRAGEAAVLATVIQTWGSAPRRVGSQMGINGAGDLVGSVSGGCVEGAVVIEAQEALQMQQPRVLEYGVSDGDAFAHCSSSGEGSGAATTTTWRLES